MAEYIVYQNKNVPVVGTAVNKEFIETYVFSNAVYAIYATKEFIPSKGTVYKNAVAVKRENIDSMLTINYSGNGHFSINLSRFLPATKKDMKTLFTAIEKGINPYKTAEQLYNYIADRINSLQEYRNKISSTTEQNKVTADIKKYISCCDCVCAEYGFDSVTDTEVKPLPKLKKSEVYIYSAVVNHGSDFRLYSVPGYTFNYSGFTFSIHHTNHKPDYNSADIMQPVKGSYYTISIGGIKAYQEFRTAKEALTAFINDNSIIDRLKEAFKAEKTISMFNQIKLYASEHNITLPDNFFPVVEQPANNPETMNNSNDINNQAVTSDNKPETATEAAEQTTEATEAEKPVNSKNSPKNSIPGIEKAVQFFSNIILSEDYKKPYFETLQRVYSCIYSYLYNYFNQFRDDNFMPVSCWYAAMHYFDHCTTETEKQLINDYVRIRNDYISSDREAVSFILAYAVLTEAGIVPEQEQPATEEQPATAVNTVYQEEQPATVETMTGGTTAEQPAQQEEITAAVITRGTTAGIIKAVLFNRMIITEIATANNNTIPDTKETARKSPKKNRIKRLYVPLYQYTKTAEKARIRANSKLKTAAFLVIATGNKSSPQQRKRANCIDFSNNSDCTVNENITELLQFYHQNC